MSKSNLLNVIEHVAIGKAKKRKDELIWESRHLSRGFTYKGVSFTSILATGTPVALSQIEADKLQLDDLCFILTEWESVKASVIQWMNQSKTLSECYLWVPDEVHPWITGLTLPDDIPQWAIDIKESEPYEMLLALIDMNRLSE